MWIVNLRRILEWGRYCYYVFLWEIFKVKGINEYKLWLFIGGKVLLIYGILFGGILLRVGWILINEG